MVKIIDCVTKNDYNKSLTHEFEIDKVLRRPIEDMDYFLRYLNSNSPDIMEQVVNYLLKWAQSIGSESTTPQKLFEVEAEFLQRYPELFSSLEKSILQLLNFSEYQDKIDDGKVIILFTDYLKSYIIPAYQMAFALTTVLPRTTALQFYKDFIDYYVQENKDSFAYEVKNPEEEFEQMKKYPQATHDIVLFLLEKGMIVNKITRCMWHELLSQFNDAEIAYAVACHIDFSKTICTNENIMLTRTKTLMQGDEYCDFCWHDKRFDDELKHPDSEFWEKTSLDCGKSS